MLHRHGIICNHLPSFAHPTCFTVLGWDVTVSIVSLHDLSKFVVSRFNGEEVLQVQKGWHLWIPIINEGSGVKTGSWGTLHPFLFSYDPTSNAISIQRCQKADVQVTTHETKRVDGIHFCIVWFTQAEIAFTLTCADAGQLQKFDRLCTARICCNRSTNEKDRSYGLLAIFNVS